MPNQNDLILMTRWADIDLVPSLPTAETQEYEFKCSLTPDDKLKTEIHKAASGFWNSGGGYLVLGVDGAGKPDGGISTSVTRQPRKDWIDRVISSVAPPFTGGYAVNEIVDGGNGLNIRSGNAVYVIGFASSDLIPHMAPDGRCYVRAGVHTDPAPAFIVEALYARRGRRQPQLRLQFRRDPIFNDTLQLGVVNVGSVPAIDVEVEFEKAPLRVPANNAGKAVVRAHVIDHNTPFYTDYLDTSIHRSDTDKRLASEANCVVLRYKDPLLNSYEQQESVATRSTVTVDLFGGGEMNRIAGSLQHIVNALCRIESKITTKPPE
jgi:hypothetical protein